METSSDSENVSEGSFIAGLRDRAKRSRRTEEKQSEEKEKEQEKEEDEKSKKGHRRAKSSKATSSLRDSVIYARPFESETEMEVESGETLSWSDYEERYCSPEIQQDPLAKELLLFPSDDVSIVPESRTSRTLTSTMPVSLDGRYFVENFCLMQLSKRPR